MSKLPLKPPQHAPKDDNGIYLPKEKPQVTVEPPGTDSIDAMLLSSLNACYKILRVIHGRITATTFDRADVQSLKDIVSMLRELRDDEKALLEGLDEADLEKLSK